MSRFADAKNVGRAWRSTRGGTQSPPKRPNLLPYLQTTGVYGALCMMTPICLSAVQSGG